jgi:hypothetical protein
MKRIAGCVVLTALAQLVSAADGVRLEPSPLQLPARIGPLAVTGSPHKYDQAALGVSYQYGADGLSLTVYVYDAGQQDIPDGADTMASCREFESAKRGVEQSYQNVELKSQRLVRLGEDAAAPLVREAVYEFERESRPTISYLWVTAVAGKFLKLRFSAAPQLRDELADAREAVLGEVAKAMQPFLKPANPDAKKPGTALNFYMGGGKGADLQTGMMYLMLLNAFADKVPESAPVCGGPFVPGFETDVSAWRGTLQMAEQGRKSRLETLLAEADSAGFLEELVWTDMHLDSWGETPPDGLDLDGYTRWRKKHVKKLARPVVGEVVLEHPRPLPIEPL